MSSSRQVLLARPHGFIVSEMRPFLEQAGYETIQLERLVQLGTTPRTLRGAIISTAVVSSVNASPEAVFTELRRAYPRLPVAFAGLVEFETMRDLIEPIVRPLHASAEILPISGEAERHPGLGRENLFLIVRKEDVADPSPGGLTERVLSRHFREAVG